MEQPEPNDTYTAEPTPTSKWKGLEIRIASAAVLALVVLLALWCGGFFFTFLISVAGLQMLREWDKLTEKEPSLWALIGLAYVAIPCASLIWLRNAHIEGNPNAGFALVLYVLFVVWATDIGAYFTGRAVGGPGLAPAISPSKTWAGLGGGMVCAGFVGGLSFLFSPFPSHWYTAVLLGIVLAVIAQAGDLFESWLKRRAGVKDSSTLIPGHGGLLDRVDGLTFTLPVFAWFAFLSGIIL